MNASIRRLLSAVGVLMSLVGLGTFGFYTLGHGKWSVSDCAYMTIITLSTVGFGELSNMHHVPWARALTVALIVSGVGALAYVQGNLTALLVEGVIGQAFRRNRMRKHIAELSDHILVAGAGSTGRHVIEELVATQTPFVVIDRDRHRLEALSQELVGGKMLYVDGDATHDQALLAANIKQAKGVVAALTHDKDNLFVTLSARSLNPGARIVAKVIEDEVGPKMVRAGATSIVSPTMIGGRRMASELIRPEVTEFLDQMLRDKDKNLRLEEVVIPTGSSFAGRALKETPIRRETRLLVVAVRLADRSFLYNPEPDFVLEAAMTLVVMGEADQVVELRKLAGEQVS
ncbi:MAG: potassium channel protein [Myxococcales bacterium]|jgi:voltage-gated potassium channel|nr:potassium channel protein [Myxococcales bacterium]